VEAVSSGPVGQIRVKRSSGYGVLDHSAHTPVKQRKFIAAKKGEATILLWGNVPVKGEGKRKFFDAFVVHLHFDVTFPFRRLNV
jgi:hypothetical protein